MSILCYSQQDSTLVESSTTQSQQTDTIGFKGKIEPITDLFRGPDGFTCFPPSEYKKLGSVYMYAQTATGIVEKTVKANKKCNTDLLECSKKNSTLKYENENLNTENTNLKANIESKKNLGLKAAGIGTAIGILIGLLIP